MRWRIPELFLGALLAVAIFAFGAVFESSRKYPTNESAKTTNTDNRGTKITTDHSPEKITDWLLVLFSGWSDFRIAYIMPLRAGE